MKTSGITFQKDEREYDLNYESCVSEIFARSNNAPDYLLRTRSFYRFFVTGILLLLLYAFISHPWLTLLFLVVSYFFHHICFMVYHSSLHAQFIEIDHSKLLTGPFIAFVHHYVNPRLLCCWEHRATYQSITVLSTFAFTFLCLLYLGGVVMLPFVATFLLWHLTSSPVHEWYHTPPKNRQAYFNRFEYRLYSTLEKMGVISTKNHITHHRHQINNKDAVVEFDDMHVGRLLSLAFDKLWSFCLRVVYQKNKKYMTIFYSVLYLLSLWVLSGLAVLIVKCVGGI